MFKKKNIVEEKLEIYSKDASSEIVEAYNSLVTNIIHFPIEKDCKVIAVTSATYGEGKSSIAINLALALAINLLDKRILLVDSDLRNSKIGEFINASSKEIVKGISDYLSGKDAEPVISKSDVSNLDVLYAGGAVDNPAGLIRSDKMGELLSSFEGKYDYVIIDTPPVNSFSDALLLSDRISGFVIATKKNNSSVAAIDNATDRIRSSGTEIFGFVFSK